tara:strand:- start:293 stop:667 length:375 start_codon:yes stop_codon:yes gene_type:complete
MNYHMHLQNESLMQQAESFRQSYALPSTPARSKIQKALIDEEWSEFHQAFHFESSENQLKELADLVYVCYQFAANLEWDLDEALKRVHKSNMSKLDEYGKPIYRADGKVLKGPNYKPPTLTDLV